MVPLKGIRAVDIIEEREDRSTTKRESKKRKFTRLVKRSVVLECHAPVQLCFYIYDEGFFLE